MNAGYMVPDNDPNQEELMMNTQEHLEYQYLQQEQEQQHDPRYQQQNYGAEEQYEYINPFKKQEGLKIMKNKVQGQQPARIQQRSHTGLQKQIKAQFKSQLDNSRPNNSGMQSRLKIIGNVHPSQVTNRVRTASSLVEKDLKPKRFAHHLDEPQRHDMQNWGTMRQRSVSPTIMQQSYGLQSQPQMQRVITELSPGMKLNTQRQDRRQWNPLTQSLTGPSYQSQGLRQQNYPHHQMQDEEGEIVNIDFQDQQQPESMAQFQNIQQSQMFGIQSPPQSFINTHGPVSQFSGDLQGSGSKGDSINEKQIQQMVFQYLNQRLGIDDNQFGAAGKDDGKGLPNSLQGINKLLEGMVDQHLVNQIVSNQVKQENHTKDQAKQISMSSQSNQHIYRSQNSITDIDSIRLTTASLGEEIREMRKQLQNMHMTGNEKDAEIIQLNMHLTDEKRKIHEMIRGSSMANLSQRSQALSQRVNINNDIDGGPNSLQKQNQLNEENEQLIAENKQLKKKLESQKKHALTEQKVLKKEIKQLLSQIQNVPDHNSINQEKEQIILEMESKFKQRYSKAKQMMQESNQQLHDQLQQEKETLNLENKQLKTSITELQDEVQKALKIHKANQTISNKYEQLKKEMQHHQNDKVLLEQTIENQIDKMSDLQRQLINVESDKEKIEQIRQLELQKSEMQKSQSDLEQKICENCITNYQKFEECQLKLSEAERKAERLENQLKNQKTNVSENSEDMSNLKNQLKTEVDKNEKFEKEISDLNYKITNLESKIQLQDTKLKQQVSIQNRTAVNAGSGKSNQNDQLIQELQQEISQLNKDDIDKEDRISELLKKVQSLNKEIQSLKQQLISQEGANALPSPQNMEPIIDNEALEAAEAEIDRLKEEIEKQVEEIKKKDQVIEQMSLKMQTDMMKSMDLMQKSTQLEGDLNKSKKEIERNKAELQIMEQLKAQLEQLTNGGKKTKEKKGLFGGSKKEKK